MSTSYLWGREGEMQSEEVGFQSAFERGQRLGCSDVHRKVISPSWGQNREQSWTSSAGVTGGGCQTSRGSGAKRTGWCVGSDELLDVSGGWSLDCLVCKHQCLEFYASYNRQPVEDSEQPGGVCIFVYIPEWCVCLSHWGCPFKILFNRWNDCLEYSLVIDLASLKPSTFSP